MLIVYDSIWVTGEIVELSYFRSTCVRDVHETLKSDRDPSSGTKYWKATDNDGKYWDVHAYADINTLTISNEHT